ncbi:hypothetical protein [Blastomonas aquatica]|uniref:hypothetical protein n=1 Tax=Blastomonas aquatica TaxID=1510276 RepID=UPI003619A94B
MKADRNIHVVVGLIALIAAIALLIFIPDLSKDYAAVFATLTGVATLYGVLFTIIEVLRTKAAADLAAAAAKDATSRVRAMYASRDAAECQACIESALRIVDEGGVVPLSVLSRISKIYAGEFADQYEIHASDVRQRILLIESYGAMPPKARTNSTKIKTTLVAMNGHLAAHISRNLSSEKV